MFTKKNLEKKAKTFGKIKTKNGTIFYKDMWKDDGNLPNPFSVVREFIMEKGLKLYGGQALHEHLAKYKKPLYTKNEFPDYDVFSPDAWNHAKELADKLYKLGFTYVEARSSILNDEHHQTFKVSVDMLYIFDITQTGCTRKQIADKDCKECGYSKDKKCISIFNNIPCNDLMTYKTKGLNKTYKETYNYETDSAVHKNKLFVCDPTWLKISMFREISEPLSNPDRLPKVGPRLADFEKQFKFDHRICKQNDYNHEMNTKFKPVLKHIAEFVKKHKIINIGATAFNFFMKGMKKHPGNLTISDYKVYCEKPIYYMNKLLNELTKKFPNMTFKHHEKKTFWKEIDTEEYILNVSSENVKHNNILTMTYHTTCMPYIQANGVRYATIDRLKYILYRAVALNEVTQLTEERPENYECILSHLLKNEKQWKKKYGKSNKHKFKRFISKCSGDEVSKIYVNLLDRWLQKNKTLKKTKFITDLPKKGYMTKIYPMPKEELYLPYKPDESKRKIVKHMNKTIHSKKRGRVTNNKSNKAFTTKTFLVE